MDYNRTCSKGTKARPCFGVVSVVACADCPKLYARCEAHGGTAGARRSLTSHRGLEHAKEAPHPYSH